MTLLIKSESVVANPVAIDLAYRATCISHYLFGDDVAASLTDRVTGITFSDLTTITIDEDAPKGARFAKNATLNTLRAQTGVQIVDLNNTGNVAAFYGGGSANMFELSGQTSGSLTKTLALNIRGTNPSNVKQATTLDSTTNGVRFFLTRFDSLENKLELLYFVNDALKKVFISTADPVQANPAAALAHTRINAINDLAYKKLKWYELGLLNEVISDVDAIKLYSAFKNSYARHGIVIS